MHGVHSFSVLIRGVVSLPLVKKMGVSFNSEKKNCIAKGKSCASDSYNGRTDTGGTENTDRKLDIRDPILPMVIMVAQAGGSFI